MSVREACELMDVLCERDLAGPGRLLDWLSSRGEPLVLLCLLHEGRPLLSGQVAARSGLTTGRVANILKSLERQEMVTRSPDASDGRRVLVSLTPRGEAAAQAELGRVRGLRRDLLAYLGEGDADEFVRLLGRCLEYRAGEGA